MRRFAKMPDAEIVERLTEVRGIGPWTVEMLLIFRMGRPDVLPVTDYGVRKGYALTFMKLAEDAALGSSDLPKPEVLSQRGKKWAPFRSVASWYLWRACDLAKGTPSGRTVEPTIVSESRAPRELSGDMIGRFHADSSKRFVCIHGHFYQPPRENPWLETVETQDTAAPYHDWNERIVRGVLRDQRRGAHPERQKPDHADREQLRADQLQFRADAAELAARRMRRGRYRMILDGERRSRQIYKGHSSAMAQVYNHVIMPLANERDRITQIRWGIADYLYHFGAAPEGMWLAETAADTERWNCWPRTESSSRCWHRTSANGIR